MTNVRCAVGVGSNLTDPLALVKQGIKVLSCFPDITNFSASHCYQSKPVGEVLDQPDFINAVVVFDTSLDAQALLLILQAIEQVHGRVRVTGQQGGPRSLDMDLLLYGDQVVDDEELSVPHPRMCERGFVLVPLAEIAPELKVPGYTQTVGEMAQAILTSVQVQRLPETAKSL